MVLVNQDLDKQELADTKDLLSIQEEEGLDDMYDDTPEPGDDKLYGLQLNEGLTDAEMVMAQTLANICRGVMIVHGKEGCGKGVLANYLSWKLRRIFKGKKILLDFKPKAIFDYGYENNRYIHFDSRFMLRQIQNMARSIGDNTFELSEEDDEINKKLEAKLSVLNKEWVEKAKTVLLLDCIQVLDELKRYCYNRKPMSTFGTTILAELDIWRHLGALILGMCPDIEEIDKKFLKHVTHEIRPNWAKSRRNTTVCSIHRKTSIGVDGVIQFSSKPFRIMIDGGSPRPEIGVQINNPNVPLGVAEKRIMEAEKLGFKKIICPKTKITSKNKIEVVQVRTLAEAIGKL